jgi:Mg/Co/Ni transporter MgtE
MTGTMLILLRFWMSLILMKQLYFKVLDSDKTAEILLELEDDLRENILSSPKRSRKN